MVRQPGRVQRHRQGDDRQHGQGDRRGRRASPSSPRPSPRRTRRAGSPRWRPTPSQVPPEHEVAGDGRGAGGQHPVLQPGQHADQQVRRRAQGPVRHDLGRHPGLGRGGDPGRQVRQDRRRRPRHAERDEALRRRRLRQVGGAVEPGRPRLRRGLRAARRRRRHAQAGRHLGEGRQARRAAGGQRQRDPAWARPSSSPRTTSTTSTSKVEARGAGPANVAPRVAKSHADVPDRRDSRRRHRRGSDRRRPRGA